MTFTPEKLPKRLYIGGATFAPEHVQAIELDGDTIRVYLLYRAECVELNYWDDDDDAETEFNKAMALWEKM